MPPGPKLIITDEFEGDVVVGTDEEDEELPAVKPTSSTIVVPGEEWMHDSELDDLTDEARAKIKEQVETETILDKFGKVGKAHTLGRGKRTQDFLLNDDTRLLDDKDYRIKPLESGGKGKARKR
jgi:hypothetical protein